MKQLSLSEARVKLGALVAQVEKGRGPFALAQGSKIKAVLVSAAWYCRVEKELAHYRCAAQQSPLKLRGSMKLTGDIDHALRELGKERQQSLERLVSGLK